MDVKNHYNHVTDAWKEFMGNNLHFGYFENEEIELKKATDVLIDKMIGLCNITENSKILDVGCGVGNPAFYIHTLYRCKIVGISTSERGIQLANLTSKENGYRDVEFRVMDGCNNDLPDKSFDIVWIMESSHLMKNKKLLFKESIRVLKQGGTLVLCDLISLRAGSLAVWLIKNFTNYIKLTKNWGNGKIESFGAYCNGLVTAGFREISIINITKEVIPTLKFWKKNAVSRVDTAMKNFSKKDIINFITGCDILESYFKDGTFGYGMIKAVKK